MTEKIQVNLRLPKEVIEQLKAEAERQKRSLNNLLEVIIDEYLNTKKDEKNG
ncbi:MAG: Arc family DNA-binding protein [Clostridia bacterium]|nr:Arc family DNA-binding protein [Clostridia bacterium]MBQ4601546.1 Arc family DNA-binding protein [Clostridia bacterium]